MEGIMGDSKKYKVSIIIPCRNEGS